MSKSNQTNHRVEQTSLNFRSSNKMQVFNLVLSTFAFVALPFIFVVSSVDGDSTINSLMYLGHVDGKSFFAEMYPRRTWFEAKQACNDSRMQQASITSERQAQLLNDNFDQSNFTGWFWTAGRDSHTLSQFIWDTNNSTISSYGVRFDSDSTIRSCLLFAPTNQYNSYICTDKWGTLCEVDQNM